MEKEQDSGDKDSGDTDSTNSDDSTGYEADDRQSLDKLIEQKAN
jgi:hypothetical protein